MAVSLAFAWKALIVDDPLAVLQFNVVGILTSNVQNLLTNGINLGEFDI